MTKNSNAVEKQPQAERAPWQRDDVQFPRLLAEILATQDTLDMTALAQSMGLSVEEVSALFDRAEIAWEAIKADSATRQDHEEEPGTLSEAQQYRDATASTPDLPEITEGDIALATAAGFRVHLVTALDGSGLNLRYWLTLCQPSGSGCETSLGGFVTKQLAWRDALSTLRGNSELGEFASALPLGKSSDADNLRATSFAVAYRSLVRKWKSKSQTARVQWPRVAKAILYRIESHSPIEALRLLKADQEKVSGFSVANFYQSAIDDVECLLILQRLESRSERIAEVAAAPADTTLNLSNIEADVLLCELRSRGLVVSAWGLEDAATPLENDDETEDLTDEQFARLEEKLLEKASVSLEDLLTSRGNEHFAIVWDVQRSRMLEEVRGNTNVRGDQ